MVSLLGFCAIYEPTSTGPTSAGGSTAGCGGGGGGCGRGGNCGPKNPSGGCSASNAIRYVSLL